MVKKYIDISKFWVKEPLFKVVLGVDRVKMGKLRFIGLYLESCEIYEK